MAATRAGESRALAGRAPVDSGLQSHRDHCSCRLFRMNNYFQAADSDPTVTVTVRHTDHRSARVRVSVLQDPKPECYWHRVIISSSAEKTMSLGSSLGRPANSSLRISKLG